MVRRPLLLTLTLSLFLLGVTSAFGESVAIGGRVVVPGGAPLPRADVRLLPMQDPKSRARLALGLAEAEPVARGLTDDDGQFRLAAPHAGLWTVRVEAPGFAPLEADLQPLIEPVELPDAEMETDSGMTVKVTDGHGSPVPGARVLLRGDRSGLALWSSRWNIPVRIGETGESGTVRLPRGEGERVSLSASAPGFAFGEIRGLHGTAATLGLAAGAPRSFQVRSADGRPVPGAMIAFGERVHPFALTDESGRIAARFDPARPVPMSVLAEDGRRLETRVEGKAAEKEKNEPTPLVLPDRISVSGRLIDAETRRFLQGGVVWDRENPLEAAVTDRAGGFVVGGSNGQRTEVIAGAPGYLNADSIFFQFADDGRPGPTLALRPAAAIEGKVVDGDGNPIGGAEVEVEVKRNPGMMRIEIGRPVEMPRGLTGSRGTFRLSSLDPAKSYRVKVKAEGFAPAEQAVTGLEPYESRSGVNVVLTRGQSIVGRVVDNDGHAIREATVELKPGQSQGRGMMQVVEPGSLSAAFGSSTDGDGKFEIRGLPAGRFDLEARRSGYAKRSVAALEVEEGSEALDIGDLVLEPGLRVQGRVTDRDGLPVEGVEVYVRESGPMMMMMMGDGPGPKAPKADAVTEPGGWFAVDDLSADERYSLRFQRTGFVAKSVGPFPLPRVEPLEVELEPASDVIGRVLTTEGEPIPGAQVNMTRSRTIEMGGNVMKTVMMQGETSDNEGRFLFEDQEPGVISLSAVASGYQEAKLDGIEIPKGEDLDDLELPLAAGAVVHGRVIAPDGRPAVGARVRLVGDTEDMMMRMMDGAPSDGNGYYRLEGMAAGPVSVEATHPDYPRTVRDVEVKEGLNSLDLNFKGGVEVTGRIVDVKGNPVIDALARLAPAGRMWGGPETRSEADGEFTMPGVQDGDYRLWVQAEGYATSAGDRQVTVAGEPVYGLEVRLDPGAAIFGEIAGLPPEQFADVSVRAEGSTFGFEGSGVDHQGNYRIENLLPGNYNVVAALANSGKQARSQVTVDPGVTDVRLDLQFGGGVTLSGRAIQADRPIAGATVYVEGTEFDHTGWNETDHDGRFSIEGLEPGGYRILLRDWRTGLAHDQTVELATSREVVLEVPTARVGGRIVDTADRQPLAGVSLTLTSEEIDSRGRIPTHTATTDLDGKFEFRSVADGTWRLSASKKGYAALSRPVTVRYEKTEDDMRLTMDPTEGLTLEARMPSGSIPSEIRVAVLDPAGGALVTGNYATGENGRVRLSSVPPGTWSLVVSAAGSATSTLQAQAPGATIPVALKPASGLKVTIAELGDSGTLATVRVRDANGAPFHALTWDGRPQDEWRMAGGQMEFASLPPGTWSVTVAAADGRTWQGDSVTAAGTITELRLE